MKPLHLARYLMVTAVARRGIGQYDLASDPDELVNLYGNAKHQKTRDALVERLVEWQRSIDDPLLRDWRLNE